MKTFTKIVAGAEFALTVKACSTTSAMSAADAAAQMSAGLARDPRSCANKARDSSRHPVETLAFFEVTPEKTVMEIWPGGGWYTEVLEPYMRESGKYIEAGWDPDAEMDLM